MTELRTHVTPLYPGAFVSETGQSVLLEEPTSDEELVRRFGVNDEEWFCLEVVTRPYERWTSDSGETKWLAVPDGGVTSRRIYPDAEVLDVEAVASMPDGHILLANMRGNGWDRVVRTRAGNTQPLASTDAVLAGVP